MLGTSAILFPYCWVVQFESVSSSPVPSWALLLKPLVPCFCPPQVSGKNTIAFFRFAREHGIWRLQQRSFVRTKTCKACLWLSKVCCKCCAAMAASEAAFFWARAASEEQVCRASFSPWDKKKIRAGTGGGTEEQNSKKQPCARPFWNSCARAAVCSFFSSSHSCVGRVWISCVNQQNKYEGSCLSTKEWSRIGFRGSRECAKELWG